MTNEWFLEALIDVFVESERFLSDDNDLLLLSIVNCLELALVRPLCAQEYNERKNATAHPIEVIFNAYPRELTIDLCSGGLEDIVLLVRFEILLMS